MSKENAMTVEVYRENAYKYLESSAVHDKMDEKRAGEKKQNLVNLFKTSFFELPKNSKIFEIGSGEGKNAGIMQAMGYDVTASDVADDFIKATKQECAKVIKFDVLNDDFPERYQGVFCWRVFVHFTKEDAAKVISKVYDVLEDGGVFIFNAINRETTEVDSQWLDFDNEYKMGAERYYQYYTEAELKDIIATTPFKIADYHQEGGKNGNKWHIFVLKKCVMEKTTIEAGDMSIPVVRIEASKLSFNDSFMQHLPQTDAQLNLKKRLVRLIKEGKLRDFYKPICDPSFARDGSIAYVTGKTPAIGKDYNWWNLKAKELAPNHNSRLGNTDEYDLFLAVVIKKLTEDKYVKFDPWAAICDDSTLLGHYWNSEDAKEDFEKTGAREILSMCDYANVFKILKPLEGFNGFYIASGTFANEGSEFPIAKIKHRERCKGMNRGVGWIIFDAPNEVSD